MSTGIVSAVPAVESIALSIAALRGQRVILDSELAGLYGVETKRFNEQVKRNAARFPADFMFQLNAEESDSLRSQTATLKTGRGQHRKYLPYVFTEHGAIMAAMVLNSPRAVEVSVYPPTCHEGQSAHLHPALSTAPFTMSIRYLDPKVDLAFKRVFGELKRSAATSP